jgi:hypothetical protein
LSGCRPYPRDRRELYRVIDRTIEVVAAVLGQHVRDDLLVQTDQLERGDLGIVGWLVDQFRARPVPIPQVLTPAPVNIPIVVPAALVVVGEAFVTLDSVTVTAAGTVVAPGTGRLTLGLEAAGQLA